MRVLGIEGGGTRTTALLADGNDAELASFAVGPGNLRLLSAEDLAALLAAIRERLPAPPDRIGVGMAGVRTDADRERLRRAVGSTWPCVPVVVGDDLLLAL